jgi:hypothetical protein
MAMSWVPGDISAIHDHGYTEWGAVQVFGPAEHATFDVKDNVLYTSSRFLFKPGDVVGVSHELIHQMGNSTDTPFMTLHVYGQPEDIESVTGDARVYELKENIIQRVDGGVFFALPEEEVKWTEACAKADFPTRLRHLVELVKRLRLVSGSSDNARFKQSLQEAMAALFHTDQAKALNQFLNNFEYKATLKSSQNYFNILKWEVAEASKLEKELQKELPNQYYSYVALANQLTEMKSFEQFSNLRASLN